MGPMPHLVTAGTLMAPPWPVVERMWEKNEAEAPPFPSPGPPSCRARHQRRGRLLASPHPPHCRVVWLCLQVVVSSPR